MQNNIADMHSIAPPDIHIRQWENRSAIFTALVALIAIVGECWLAVLVVHHHFSVAQGGIFHILGLLALSMYALFVRSNARENRFALMLLMATAALGPFGAVGVLLAIIWQTSSVQATPPSFDELFEMLLPSHPKSMAQHIYDDIVSGRDESDKRYSVIPFMDVLAFGNTQQKRKALEKMTSHFHPRFAPLFKKAINDSNNMIRVQAALAIAKIESRFLRRMIDLSFLQSRYLIRVKSTTTIAKIETGFLRRVMDVSPLKSRNPGYAAVILALAVHYDDYAFTGLLDADRERTNRTKALEYYQKYLALQPDDSAVCVKVGRLLLRSGEYEKACAWFAHIAERNKTEDADISDWYSEALFITGRYEELRKYRTGVPATPGNLDTVGMTTQAAAKLWAGGAA